MEPLLIIGTGLSGYNLAREFRKIDKERPVILITADDGRSYSKPMLSTGFTKGKDAAGLAMADAQAMAQQLAADIRTQAQVVRIDTVRRQVELADGDTLTYGDLVLAWGAEVFRPTLGGDGTDTVYSVNDLLDYDQFRQALAGKQRVAIIGGGLIGCEFANDLANGGFAVQVIEPLGRCLPTLLPEPASRAVEAGLRDLGVGFVWGSQVTAVHKQGEALAVELANGEQLEADIVVSAIGLRPRIAQAKAAGLVVNRGICVNRQLQTSAEHVYALGDCAEVEGHVLLYVLPLMASARALARTLAGQPTEVQYGPMPVTIKTPVCPVVVSPPPPGVEGDWQISGEGRDLSACFYDQAGALRGFALTGGKVSEKTALARQLPDLLS